MTACSHVLILTSKTGGGHWSAAQAIEDSLLRVSAGHVMVSISQVLEEASVITKTLADLYNWLLRNKQPWMRYYFNWIEHARINECKPLFESAFGYAQRLFEKVCPDVLVSVHPMTQHFFAYVCNKLGLNIPLVTVVTDPAPGFWSAWACPGVERYYVATQPAKLQLTQFGVPAERIYVMGMPVRPDFQPVVDRFALRQQLGLNPEAFTLLMSAGYIGGGNVPELFNHISAAPFDGQIVYLTGHNHQLYEQAKQLASTHANIHPLLYVPNIAPWLQASDVIVTKLGGLTTYEALACEVPVLADCMTPPMPQEAQTVDFLTQIGAARRVTGLSQFSQTVFELQSQPNQLDAMRNAGRQLIMPGASDAIARDVLALSPKRRLVETDKLLLSAV